MRERDHLGDFGLIYWAVQKGI